MCVGEEKSGTGHGNDEKEEEETIHDQSNVLPFIEPLLIVDFQQVAAEFILAIRRERC